jgi:hypothetical protein
LDTGKPIVIVFAVIPTVLVLAFSRAVTSADGVVVTVLEPLAFPEPELTP